MNKIFLKKKIIPIIIVLLVLIIGRNLNPFDDRMLKGHDETQAARVSEFSLNLKNGNIPPRIAPNMSYGLSYPIFNYYAPFAYWATSLIHISGLSVPQALESSYLLAMAVGGVGMYLFLKEYFDKHASLIGSVAYFTAPYTAVEVFVRGNLAEVWFFALFPLSLYLIKTVNLPRLPITALFVSFLLTSHNIFSLIGMMILIFYSLILRRKYSIISIVLGLLLAGYFIIPAFGELGLTNAVYLAKLTDYKDHFLCIGQLWSSPWGYAGSAKGCQFDGMTFMLGKLHIVFSIIGILVFGYFIKKEEKQKNIELLYFLLILIFSIFLTTKYSAFFWDLLEPILSTFQFPWRFLLLGIFGMAVFIPFTISKLKNNLKLVTSICLVLIFVWFNISFFTPDSISIYEFQKSYLNNEYIRNISAYKVPEYLPKSADYKQWRALQMNVNGNSDFNNPFQTTQGLDVKIKQNNPFKKVAISSGVGNLTFNIHYAPYWKIFLNGNHIYPKKVDNLGRPIININYIGNNEISIIYSQTPLEKIANFISGITIIILVVLQILIISPKYAHRRTQKL